MRFARGCRRRGRRAKLTGMGATLFLSMTALAAFLVGLDRRGAARLLAFGFGGMAAAVALWVMAALIAVYRPF